MQWVNGQVNGDKVVLDDGFWFGRGVFETIRVHEQPLFWTEHINRLNDGLKKLQVRAAVDADQLMTQIQSLGISQCVVKIAVSADNIVFQTRPLPEPVTKPFRLLPIENQRTTNKILLECKSLNYLENLLARDQAVAAGYDDVLFMKPGGELSETSRANIFFIRDGKIYTPDPRCGLLNGVIRQWVMANFTVETGEYLLDELLSADAVFVTNSVIGIQKVAVIGDRAMGESRLVDEIDGKYANAVQ